MEDEDADFYEDEILEVISLDGDDEQHNMEGLYPLLHKVSVYRYNI